jgi:photosystem II stability/assembly factor-like uncharacterized protein
VGVVSVVAPDQPGGNPVTQIFSTADGGWTWRLAAELPVEGAAGPAALDQNHWLLVTNPFGLLATTDAGKSWQPVTHTLGTTGWFTWVGRLDSQRLAALGPAGNAYPGPVYLYVSADLGRTWQPVG